MAKGKYQRWLEPDGLTLLRGWARDGLTDKKIADKIGIHVSTLYEWENKHPEISEALKKGKEVVDYEAEEALLDAVKAGNVAAIIFWLKNRRPDKWRDKPVPESRESEELHNELMKALREAVKRDED